MSERLTKEQFKKLAKNKNSLFDLFHEAPCDRTDDCLAPSAIYNLAVCSDDVSEKELKHVVSCSYCRAQVSRLRRYRDILNDPLPDEPGGLPSAMANGFHQGGLKLYNMALDHGNIDY